jgi:hypothetical protein
MIYRGKGRRVIWLLHNPPLIATQRKTEKERKLSAGREGGGVGRGVKSYEQQESLVLYKSFNTLWVRGTGLTCVAYKAGVSNVKMGSNQLGQTETKQSQDLLLWRGARLFCQGVFEI